MYVRIFAKNSLCMYTHNDNVDFTYVATFYNTPFLFRIVTCKYVLMYLPPFSKVFLKYSRIRSYTMYVHAM